MTLFGTDGIRGEAGQPPLDAATVARVGAALARVSARPAPRVLIGRDTRESGTGLEAALTRGIAAEGGSVVSLGVVPVPSAADTPSASGFRMPAMLSGGPDRGEVLIFIDSKALLAGVAAQPTSATPGTLAPWQAGGTTTPAAGTPAAAQSGLTPVLGGLPNMQLTPSRARY